MEKIGQMLGEIIAPLRQRIGVLETIPRHRVPPDAFFDHFYGDGTIGEVWTVQTANSGVVSLPNASPTYARLTTGVLANSTAHLTWGSAGVGRFALIGGAALTRVGARMRMPLGGTDANTFLRLCLNAASGQTLSIGVRGATSTTHYAIRSTDLVTPTDTATGTPIDTEWHEFEIWIMGTAQVWFLIDGVMVAEVTANLPTGPYALALETFNVGTAADRRLEVDWVYAFENEQA